MKRVICFALAVIFALALCSCAKTKPEDKDTATDKEMIIQVLSDLSKKNFKEIASRSVLKDGTPVTEADIEEIYNYIVQSGADPSLGFSLDNYSKSVGIDASDDSKSRTYEITALCGEKPVRFRMTISRLDKGSFFTQIYTLGVVNENATTAETE